MSYLIAALLAGVIAAVLIAYRRVRAIAWVAEACQTRLSSTEGDGMSTVEAEVSPLVRKVATMFPGEIEGMIQKNVISVEEARQALEYAGSLLAAGGEAVAGSSADILGEDELSR